MRRVTSKQVDVRFVWCGFPITIDKRAEWGDKGENIQIALEGAFLKIKAENEVSHLVQPNADKSAPMGWILGSKPGFFNKQPIYIGETIEKGVTVEVETLDGKIIYTTSEKSVICANEKNGQPDMSDQWVQKMSDIEKNYIII
jgi:hypothetical protein